jgi:hypothetical protein
LTMKKPAQNATKCNHPARFGLLTLRARCNDAQHLEAHPLRRAEREINPRFGVSRQMSFGVAQLSPS